MLKLILKRYLWFGILINLLLIIKLDDSYILIYIFNVVSIVAYYLVLHSQLSKPSSYYRAFKLGWIVFFYSLFFVIAFNVISYYYNQNYFVFSEWDAGTYHWESLQIVNESFWVGIEKFLVNWSFEDLGAVLVISTLYQIVDSNLIVNLFYLLSGVIASLFIFRIGRKFMSRKYAYLAALTYSTSSFVLWFHASGLKESILIFLIILFFDQYYEFKTKKKVFNIVFMTFSLLSIILFRPAITFLILGSVGMTALLSRRKSPVIVILIPISLILLFFIAGFIEVILNKFIGTGGIAAMLARREAEGMIKMSLPVTIATNILATLFGPFPTLIPGSNMVLSFYSVGLIFKVLLSSLFWIGAYHAYKRKLYQLLPLILFVVFEGFSLAFILEGLELRKSLPHFFAVFLVGFWFLDFLNRKYSMSVKYKRKMVSIVKYSSVLFFLLILLWNLKGA